MGADTNGKINRRSEAAKARAARLLADDPNHFANIARNVKRRGKQTASPAGFTDNPDAASRAGRKSSIVRKEKRLQESATDSN